MEQNIIQTDIHRAVEAIKVAILQTRRKVMIQANKDSLALNYSIGGYISCRKQTSHWGDKVLDAISSQLQQELPGLRGFTKSNLKKMCVFYEGWKEFFGIIFFKGNNSVTSNKISPVSADNDEITIGQLITDQFDKATLEAFLTVQFTHHYEILRRSESINERLFYIRRVASEFWSVDKLKYNIREQLYLKEGTMPNNFAVTLHDGEQKQKAMRAFRKNYKLDFIEIDDVDEWDEHKVETKIVENIKRFIKPDRSMSKELSKGLRIYDILSNNDFGILLKNEADCNNPVQPFDNDVSLSDLADILYRMETEKENHGIGATATAFGFKYGKAINTGGYSCGAIIDEAKKIHPDFELTHTERLVRCFMSERLRADMGMAWYASCP